ncbi:MAG: hypothetical protein ACOVP4_09120 [Bacteriovoracaceae bacterium]
MQLNKKLSFLIPVLFFAACTKKVENKLLLDHWSVREKEVSIVERKLAAAGDAECMIDTFTEETLKAEIASIEEKYKKEQKLEGSFEHLDFRDLPVTQAKYLKSYGKSLGDLTGTVKFDFSSCSNVPCILNKIYGQDSGVEGYAIYLWYLKTGHSLGVDNFVPGQKSSLAGQYQGKKISFQDYLFSRNELYGFWRLSHMLNSSYKNLPFLKEIQRVPKGNRIEGEASLTCGLASFTWLIGVNDSIVGNHGGSIILSDSCLEFGYNNNMDGGFFYEAVTHEIAHEVDYHVGYSQGKRNVSTEKEWMDLSGWQLKEERVVEGTQTTLKREYSIQKGFTQFVSSYAQNNPAETFADTLSMYIHNGDHTKKSIPKQLFDIIKKDYYVQQEYTLDENVARIVQRNYSRYVKDILDLTVSCMEPSSDSKSVYFSGVSFKEKIPPLMLSCMGAMAESLEKSVFAHIKMTEPEGCNISKIELNGAKKLQESWRKLVASQIDDAFGKMKNDSQYLARIKEFYEKLSQDQGPQRAYVTCYGEADEKSCYSEKLKEMAELRVSSLGASPAQQDEMIRLYIDSFEFQAVQGQVRLYYQNFIKGQSAVISESSESIWKQCLQVKADNKEAPTGTLFNVGSDYMVSSLYNCLNHGLPDAVKNLVRKLEIDGRNVRDGKEELIFGHELMPIVVSELKDYLARDKGLEADRIKDYETKNKQSLKDEVLSGFNWATNYVDNQKIIDDCKATVLGQMTIDLYFHQKREAFSSSLDEICAPVPKSQEFSKYLDSIRGELEGKSFKTLEGYTLEAAGVVAKECVVKFPVDTALNRVKFKEQRENCLKTQWPTIEKNALGRLQAEPLVIKFQIDTSGYAKRLKDRARVLQLKTIKEYFDR